MLLLLAAVFEVSPAGAPSRLFSNFAQTGTPRPTVIRSVRILGISSAPGGDCFVKMEIDNLSIAKERKAKERLVRKALKLIRKAHVKKR